MLQSIKAKLLALGAGGALLAGTVGGAVAVHAQTPTPNDQPTTQQDQAPRGEVEGVIKSLDQTKHTVTIGLDDGKEITLQVTEATKIEGDLQEEDHEGDSTFAALSVGQQIDASYDADTKVAFKIEVADKEQANDQDQASAQGRDRDNDESDADEDTGSKDERGQANQAGDIHVGAAAQVGVGGQHESEGDD